MSVEELIRGIIRYFSRAPRDSYDPRTLLQVLGYIDFIVKEKIMIREGKNETELKKGDN